jgi:hypothetical protein
VTPPGSNGPEKEAREEIDAGLTQAGWIIQDRGELNLFDPKARSGPLGEENRNSVPGQNELRI